MHLEHGIYLAFYICGHQRSFHEKKKKKKKKRSNLSALHWCIHYLAINSRHRTVSAHTHTYRFIELPSLNLTKLSRSYIIRALEDEGFYSSSSPVRLVMDLSCSKLPSGFQLSHSGVNIANVTFNEMPFILFVLACIVVAWVWWEICGLNAPLCRICWTCIRNSVLIWARLLFRCWPIKYNKEQKD